MSLLDAFKLLQIHPSILFKWLVTFGSNNIHHTLNIMLLITSLESHSRCYHRFISKFSILFLSLSTQISLSHYVITNILLLPSLSPNIMPLATPLESHPKYHHRIIFAKDRPVKISQVIESPH